MDGTNTAWPGATPISSNAFEHLLLDYADAAHKCAQHWASAEDDALKIHLGSRLRSHDAALRSALAAAERRAEEAEANLATATWTPSDDRVMELLVAEKDLASERAARESWERECNVANAERIRLHNEAENLSERLHQFEAAGFPDVATVLDRVETERAARERAEARLRETEVWHKAAVRERDLMREQMDEILRYEDIETPGPDENVASVVLAALEHLREARERAERERDEAALLVSALRARIPSMAPVSEVTRLESRLSRAVEALRVLLAAFLVLHRAYGTGDAEQWPEVQIARAVLAEVGK